LFITRRHKHLFKTNQTIAKPIHHLRYKNKIYYYPCASDYPYRIPFDYFYDYNKLNPRKAPDNTRPSHINTSPTLNDTTSPVDKNDTAQASTSSTTQPHVKTRSQNSPYYKVKNIENWIALPPEVERKLPKIYLPFVPIQPLYSRSKKRYYPPGSPKWHEHIKEAYRADCEYKSKEKARNKLQAKADYHGTTISKVNWRSSKIEQLTNFQNRIHNAYSQQPKGKQIYGRRKKPNQENLQFKRYIG
jgi:hypothetical protein